MAETSRQLDARLINPGNAEKGTAVEMDGTGRIHPVGGTRLFATPTLCQMDIDDVFPEAIQ